jgi:hypothetical protein
VISSAQYSDWHMSLSPVDNHEGKDMLRSGENHPLISIRKHKKDIQTDSFSIGIKGII